MDETTAGVFDVVSEEVEHQLPTHREENAEQTQKPAEEPEAPEPKNKDVEEPEPTEPEEPVEPEQTETPEPKGEKTVEETKTEEPSQVKPEAVEEVDWKAGLPPPPQPYAGKKPEYDQDGNITNMTAPEYENYLIARADERSAERTYINQVENRALDAAEQILPELKSNPEIRKLVEGVRYSQIYQGNLIDSYEAAKIVKQALGLGGASAEQIAQAKAEAAKSVKTHIEVQKNAAVETKGATQKKAEPSKATQLMRRLKRGESEAMVELMDLWQEDGKV